jgi:hypothetical protein
MVARLLAALALVSLIVTGLERSLPGRELRDFGSFIASAAAGARGENPYGVYPLTFHVVAPGFDVWNPNLNPPLSVVFFRAFERFDTAYAFRLWWSISLVCYAAAVLLLAHRYGARAHWLLVVWAFAHAGLWDTLWLGQLYLPLVLVVVASWLLLDMQRPFGAGALIGIVIAIKPNFLVWPALLLLARHWRAPATAVLVAAVLTLLPMLTHGTGLYREWAQVIVADGSRGAFLTNASLPGLMQRSGLAPMGALLSVAALASAALWSFRRRPPMLEASAVGLALGIAASPIAWVHYTLFLLPVFFRGKGSPMLTGAAALLVIPVPFVLHFLDAPLWQQASIGSAYNWAVLCCLGGLAMNEAYRPRLSVATRTPALASRPPLMRTRDGA